MATRQDPERGVQRRAQDDLTLLPLPSRRGSRRRDRRGRGIRGPLLPPGMPAARTRAERFDDAVLDAADHLARRWKSQLESVEFAVENVPPSEPTSWEAAVPLGRYFPADAVAGLGHRIVIYRRPLLARVTNDTEMRLLVHDVVLEHVAHLLGLPPEQVDPG